MRACYSPHTELFIANDATDCIFLFKSNDVLLFKYDESSFLKLEI